MYTNADRDLLFYAGCLPLRTGLALAARSATQQQLKLAGAFAFIPAVLFIIVFVVSAQSSKANRSVFSRADKGAFGGPVWWQWTRPIHGLILLMFAITASAGHQWAWRFLGLDATLALMFYQFKPQHLRN